MPTDPRGERRKARWIYAVAATAMILAVNVAFSGWMTSQGLPWYALLVGHVTVTRLLVWLSGPLSVPAIDWMVRRAARTVVRGRGSGHA